MKRRNRILMYVASVLLFGSLIFTNIKVYNLNNQLSAMTNKYNSLNEDYKKLQKENNKNKKDLKYFQSDEYIESIKLSKISNLTGLNVTDYYPEDFVFTYYSSHPSENGGYTTTCTGDSLRDGIVASNYYPLGTKLYIDGQVYVVADRGSSRFNSPNRLDVFVPRNGGESDSSYLERVNNMGKRNKDGYVLTVE